MKIFELAPKIGDRIKMEEEGVEATLIAHDPNDKSYLLGWLSGEPLPDGILRDKTNLDGGSCDPRKIRGAQIISDIQTYTTNEWYYNLQVSAATVKKSNLIYLGMTCSNKYCNSWVSMAAPNTQDGRFFCYQCRQIPSYMRKE